MPFPTFHKSLLKIISTCCIGDQINEPLLSRGTIAVGKVDHRLQVVDRLQHRRTHRTRRLAQVSLVGRLAAEDVVDHFFDQNGIALKKTRN
jgi:hypothetical protein